jgi:hypothetical protein
MDRKEKGAMNGEVVGNPEAAAGDEWIMGDRQQHIICKLQNGNLNPVHLVIFS